MGWSGLILLLPTLKYLYVPLRKIVIEIDSPYFKPHGGPRRIQHSDPQMVLQVARYLSKVQVSLAEVLRICDDNARNLFKLDYFRTAL